VKRTGWWIAVLALTALPVAAQDVVEESPFIINGRPLGNPIVDYPPEVVAEYAEVARQFPTAQSCLDRPIADVDDMLEARLIFCGIPATMASKVCLYRVFRRLETPQNMQVWMEAQGWLTYVLDEPTTVSRTNLAPANMTAWARESSQDVYQPGYETERPALGVWVTTYPNGTIFRLLVM
jgi:hypothetical protein